MSAATAADLEAIRRALLDPSSTAHDIERALDRYAELCESATGIVPDPGFDAWSEDQMLDSGIAINPSAAAHCVRDRVRTVTFQRGLHAALTDLLARGERDTVHLLYAGCGPWATLLLPILGDFPATRLRIELIDIHADALTAVTRLQDVFGLGHYAIETHCADATRFQCAHAPDLVVTETMHKALEQEPQFGVTANLAPQLAPNGVLIPERIDVDLCVTGPGGQTALAHLLTLSAASWEIPPPTDLRIPALSDPEHHAAELRTSIRVYGAHRLEPDDAHITLPRPCPELSPLQIGRRTRIVYRPGAFPIFEFTDPTTEAGTSPASS